MNKYFSKKFRDSFSIIELITLVVIIALVLIIALPNTNNSKLQLVSQKIELYLNYIRYVAFIDNKFTQDDSEWEKKRWSLKFQRCSNPEDGLYFVAFSDEFGGTGAFKKVDTLKDPLNNKYMYSGYDCIPSHNESENILLTKQYGITKVEVSCNTTATIGQISFGFDGKIYSQLGTNIKEITKPCLITFYDLKGEYSQIILEPKTGYVHKQ